MTQQAKAPRLTHRALLGAIACALTFPLSGPATGAAVELFEWALAINNDVYAAGASAPGTSTSGFDTATGLGTIAMTISGAGTYRVRAFFDHEIDEATNTFFNEYGTAIGSPSGGATWEIDEPGYVFGDIYANFLAGTLDDANGVPVSAPDDVAMALGWDFTLAATKVASVQFNVAPTAPGGSFYLQQTDPDSSASIFLWSTLNIRDAEQQSVPEPTSLALLGLGLAAWAGARGRAANT